MRWAGLEFFSRTGPTIVGAPRLAVEQWRRALHDVPEPHEDNSFLQLFGIVAGLSGQSILPPIF